MIKTHPHPSELRRSSTYSLRCDGAPVEIFQTEEAHFALVEHVPGSSATRFEITAPGDCPPETTVKPWRAGIACETKGNTVTFAIDRPVKVQVEIPGLPQLFVWVAAPETDRPDPEDPDVRYYVGGRYHDEGEIRLESGQTLYLEAGAVVRGYVRALSTENIRIGGHGILDGSGYSRAAGTAEHMVQLAGCRQVTIRDLTLIHPSAWMIVPGNCEHVHIANVKEIGEVLCSDGIDVVGSRHVLIEDCFLRNNDDCVVIKACFKKHEGKDSPEWDFRKDVHDVVVRDCALCKAEGGNAMELGYELATDAVRAITFESIDVLHTSGAGAVFSIHNGDRATISDVTFRDIHVEHCYSKFIDFRIVDSRYNEDEDRGHVRDIRFEDIHWTTNRFNAGSTISLMSGYDAAHRIESVHFERIFIDGEAVTDIDRLEICQRHCRDITLGETRLPEV